MTTGELLKKLFQSYQKRDEDGFRAAAAEIITAEERKNHKLLARDLRKILSNGNGRQYVVDSVGLRKFEKLPKDNERGTILLDIRTPDRYLDDVILSEHVTRQVDIILEEYRAGDVLRTYGLRSRNKLLFCGPPGCGKTVTAEALAGELGLPLLYTRFDAVISSFLGETASNLRKVFDYASRGRWVVFFDEFDAIGKSRDNLEEHGELKRVVNTFLQLLDNFQTDSLFIAATNHEGLLDSALWRRFDDIVLFERPDDQQIHGLVQLKLRGFRHRKLDIESFVPKLRGWSHSDIERVCIEAMKISVLEEREEVNSEVFLRALERQKDRNSIIRENLTQ
jgi:SpoVK/Ycf46/Vps4 family AAA+-type ATPase